MQGIIHEAAARGFEIAPDSYERGRPEYPMDAVEYLIKKLHLNSQSTVVDLGAGTGKFTKLLLSSRAKVVAVEPVEGMRKKLISVLPSVEVLNGTAESIPLPDKSVDAVVAAQAFHWFDGSAALKEISRVLKPHGKLGLIWNARDESVRWVSKLTDIIDPHEKGAPRYRSGRWREAFEGSNDFTELQSVQFRYIQAGPPEMIVDRVASISFISALPKIEHSQVLDQVRAMLRMDPKTSGAATLELPYSTNVFWCEKRTS